MKTVLVVSGDKGFTDRVRETMEAGGHRVRSASAGEAAQAEQWLPGSSKLPDLVIVDSLPFSQVCFFIARLRSERTYEGPILGCDSRRVFQEAMIQSGATRTCESWRWSVPAYDLLGLMVKE